jgi:hypothetical protein
LKNETKGKNEKKSCRVFGKKEWRVLLFLKENGGMVVAFSYFFLTFGT